MSFIDIISALQFLPFWLRGRPSLRNHIFITGAPRSGTTLLKTILVAHSQIGGTDYESTGIFKYRNLYAYYTSEIDKSSTQNILKTSDSIVAFYDSYSRLILQQKNKNVFVDKVWPSRFRLPFVASRFPNARWLHIVRDGRDCYCSARKHPHIPQARDVRVFARYWKLCILLCEQSLPPKGTFNVRYEDFTACPECWTKALMDFIGLSCEMEQLQSESRARATSMWRRDEHARLKQAITPASMGRWRRELTPNEVAVFERIAGDELRRWNYSTGELS